MRSSAFRNFSPGSGVRPSTVIGVQAKASLKGRDVTPPAAIAPGECSSLSQSWRYVFRMVGLSLYFRPVMVRSKVSTPRGLKPGDTSCRRAKLRMRSPAPINRTTESASSATTSSRRTLLPRPQTALVPAEPRLASFRVELKSSRETRRAGTRPKRIPQKTESSSVNRSTRPSIPTSCSRGMLFVPRMWIHLMLTRQIKMPSAPPQSESSRLSVSN